MNLNYKNKLNYNNVFLNYNLILIKKHLNCFSLFDSRMIEAFSFKVGNYSFGDIGFKYVIKIKTSNNSSNNYYLVIKILRLETLFNDCDTDSSSIKDDINRKLNWSFIKKAFNIKCILSGKILNTIKNGFSVGICGFIGFMPKKHSIISYPGNKSVFNIINIDILKRTFILSQKQLHKSIFRILFRLSSQISYISKN